MPVLGHWVLGIVLIMKDTSDSEIEPSSVPSMENRSCPSFAYDTYAHHGRNLIQDFHANLKASLPVGGAPILRSMATSAIHTYAAATPQDPVGILGAGRTRFLFIVSSSL